MKVLLDYDVASARKGRIFAANEDGVCRRIACGILGAIDKSEDIPFVEVAKALYFIGYSRSPRTIEQMLENMFIGRPPGNYDRILDFSTPVTGNLFFIPTSTFLDSISPDQPAPSVRAAQNATRIPALSENDANSVRTKDDSLGIGSLKGEDSHE